MDEFIKNNQKLIRVLFVVYIILVIVVLVYIWIPKTEKVPDIAYYTKHTDEEALEKTANYYYNNLSMALIVEDYDEITNHISSAYLDYKEIDKTELINMLKKKNIFSFSTKITNTKVTVNDTTYFITFDLINGTNTVRLNLFETAPYEYYYSLDDVVYYADIGYYNSFEGYSVIVNKIINKMDRVEYYLEIKNDECESVHFNMSSVSDVYVVCSDGTKVSIENPIEYNEETLKKGTSMNRMISFNVPVNIQKDISYILFTNVSVNGVQSSIKIDM